MLRTVPVGAPSGPPQKLLRSAMPPEDDFEKASQEKPVGIVREFLQFLAENKKWWLLPIVVVLVLCSLLALLRNGNFPPYIYAHLLKFPSLPDRYNRTVTGGKPCPTRITGPYSQRVPGPIQTREPRRRQTLRPASAGLIFRRPQPWVHRAQADFSVPGDP